MPPYQPNDMPSGSKSEFEDLSGEVWEPLYEHSCTFEPDIFMRTMMNLVRNPNLNSSWLFRADIAYDDDLHGRNGPELPHPPHDGTQKPTAFITFARDMRGYVRERTLVRTLIPRNTRRDSPLDQTCTFHRADSESSPSQATKTLVVYCPHASSSTDLPFYHPRVKGIAHLHEWDPDSRTGKISIHFLPYADVSIQDPRLRRTGYHLLEILHKHGHSSQDGYVKRVRHDVIVAQKRCQDRYTILKDKYARNLIDSWVESTDPGKHVFEDLAIAAFLVELWADMYRDDTFPGFVDIGCGNGLLVYILNEEGFRGWGFDARERKSWAQYRSSLTARPASDLFLEKRLLLPSVVTSSGVANRSVPGLQPEHVHDGYFTPGTFIVSNHADELTPWTPILGALSSCPFIMIPCCSHDLTGAKFRAPPPRDKGKAKSTYASLVDWVARIAEDTGWEVETEMLRIPSTRNTCLLGRRRTVADGEVDIALIIEKYGGVQGYADTVGRLVKKPPSGH